MKHNIIYKCKGIYSSFPIIKKENDKLLLSFYINNKLDHWGTNNRITMYSDNEGKTWHQTGNGDYQYNWRSKNCREAGDRFTKETDDNIIVTSSLGIEKYKDKKGNIKYTPSNKLYTVNIKKPNLTGRREEFEIPGVDYILVFPRHLELTNDETILIPMYGKTKLGDVPFIWRRSLFDSDWELCRMFPDNINGNEMAFIQVEHKILALIRDDRHAYLMESWSGDNGLTWSYPRYTSIKGTPPHLLRLKDGRILCTYGYRFRPMGIRAVISNDGGKSWGNPLVLRCDGGHASEFERDKLKYKFMKKEKKYLYNSMHLGYPVSIQLKDDSILTVYYFTGKDGITGIESTMWEV
jgi:hypothetical protein